MLDFLNDTGNIWGLIVGTLLGSEISRYLYMPNVIIKFKGIIPLFSDNGFFISVVVANKGRMAAISTQGKLTLFYKEERLMNPSDYKLDAIENSLPRYSVENINIEYPRHQLLTPSKRQNIQNSSICWATLGNPDKTDINPGASEELNVVRIQSYDDGSQKFWYLIFPSEHGWRKVRCRIKLLAGDTINGKLFLCPNNTFPTVRKIKFKLDSNDQQPKFIIEKYSKLEYIYYFFNKTKLYFD